MGDTPQVWIGCLAAYNGGDLHGQWVDATDADGIAEAGAEVIRTSPAWKYGGAEELFIADYDGFPGGIVRMLGEYPDYEQVAAIASAIEEHGAAFSAWVDDNAYEISATDDLVSRFEESYRGEWDSEEAYAYDFIESCGWAGLETIPDELLNYLDMAQITRELFQHGPYSSASAFGGGVYVFEAM